MRGLTMSLSKKYHGAEVVTLEKNFGGNGKVALERIPNRIAPVEYSAQDKFKTVR